MTLILENHRKVAQLGLGVRGTARRQPCKVLSATGGRVLDYVMPPLLLILDLDVVVRVFLKLFNPGDIATGVAVGVLRG